LTRLVKAFDKQDLNQWNQARIQNVWLKTHLPNVTKRAKQRINQELGALIIQEDDIMDTKGDSQ
jgi:hypothetical protein